MRIEPVLGKWVSEAQRGFIGGRSMLANLVDIDEAMIHAASQGEEAVAFFYDFAAAIPRPPLSRPNRGFKAFR